MEDEVKAKNDQLEELYAQIDSMQECITQLEEEGTAQKQMVSRL
jgi:peptidoglycan hydrolase CwlO-like protein